MKLLVKRFASNHKATIGAFYIDGIFKCFTIEDEKRGTKVAGETRVPEGVYQVAVRNEGGMNAKYAQSFPTVHKGMIAIFNKPNWILENKGMKFQYVMIHIGNNESQTDGCLLVNYSADATTYEGGNSRSAYLDCYIPIIKALQNKEEVTIEYKDVENE